MTRDYVGHWIIGICATLVWFWGAKVDIPPSAINLAAWIVPGLLAHAIGRTTFTQAPTTIMPATSFNAQPDPVPVSTPAPTPALPMEPTV